jgi:hypothetical protein
MKRSIFAAVATFLLILFFSPQAQAQCKGFAKKICKAELGDYTHDGNFHAAILTEGEEAELYKTFYSDQEYRIAICGADNIPDVEFKVVDNNRNVLYDNKANQYAKFWDFRLESSQQLKIVIKVVTSGTSAPASPDATPQSGCVSIMFGFKEKK